jgi:hypothetical protein
MRLFTALKRYLLSLFREVFVWHLSSLEFRAKLFGVVIGASNKYSDCDRELLKEICHTIYSDEDRVETLIDASEEYIRKVIDGELDINKLVLNIDSSLKKNARFKSKIILEDLRRFLYCYCDEDDKYLQIRVIEFLESAKSTER